MQLARYAALVPTVAVLAGCATMETASKAKPANEGKVRQHKYAIYDATAATISDEGFLVVCVVGDDPDEEDIAYSLVLRTDGNSLDRGQISANTTDQETLPEYNIAPRDLGEACEDPPAGTAVDLITLDIPEPIKYEYMPITNTEFRNRLAALETPPDMAVVKVKRSRYCSEVIVWNPAAESPEMELVRVSTPTEEWTVAGDRAWYILMPFTVLLDVATLPLQPVFLMYRFGSLYDKGHLVYC